MLGGSRVQVPDYYDLRSVDFETELPAAPTTYTDQDAWQPPAYFLSKFHDLQKNQSNCRFVAVGDDKITLQVTLEGLDTQEEQQGSYTVRLKLKEYREYGVRSADVERLPRSGKIPEIPTVAVIPKGQTLGDLTKGYGYPSSSETFGALMKPNPLTLPDEKQIALYKGKVSDSLIAATSPKKTKEIKPYFGFVSDALKAAGGYK